MEKLLFATSNPIEGQLHYLDFEMQIVRDLVFSGHTNINFIPCPNISFLSLSTELKKHPDLTMLHYSGHSNQDGFNLNFAGENANMDKKVIANLLSLCPNLKFVFLNSCCSQEIVDELVKAGIPYVIGTKTNVKDLLASVVAYQFYDFFVSSSITAQQAFDNAKATLELKELQFNTILNAIKSNISENEKKQINISRSLGAEEEEGFSWFYKESDAAQQLKPKDKWKIYTGKNFKLSDVSNENNFKTLIIYENDVDGLFWYNLLKPIIFEKQQSVVNHGAFEISEPFLLSDFNKEYEKADLIIHLLHNDSYADFLENKGINSVIDNYKKIPTCVMPLRDKSGSLQNTKWFNENQLLTLKDHSLENILLKINPDFRKLPDANLKDFIEIVYKGNWEEQINKFLNNEAKLSFEDVLKEIPISQFDITKYNQERKNFYFSLIEGTPYCAQQLIISKFKKESSLDKNTSLYLITFKSNNTVLIKNEEDFWENLYKSFVPESDREIIIDKEEYKENCLATILKRLTTNKLVVVFEGIENSEDSRIVENFWNSIILKFNFYLQKKIEFKGSLFLFAINFNYQQNVNFSNFVLDSPYYADIKYSPMLPLTKIEFGGWNNLSRFTTNQPLTFEDLLENNELLQRKKVIQKVCLKLKKPYVNIDTIVNY